MGEGNDTVTSDTVNNDYVTNLPEFLLELGPFLTPPAVARALETTTKGVLRRVRNHRLLAVTWISSKNRPRLLFPEWQVHEGRVRDQVLKAMPALVAHQCGDMSAAGFFVTPNDDLGGAKPYEAQGDVAAVASTWAAANAAQRRSDRAANDAADALRAAGKTR